MSAELLKKLIEAGTPAELVAEVAMLAGEVGALERRRESERENTRRYRSRLGKEIPGLVRREVFERDDYRCIECGSEDRLEIDHITPMMAAGTNDFDNLQTLCRSCNARKRDRVRKSDKRGLSRTSSESPAQSGIAVTPSLDKVSPQTPFQTKPNPTPPYNPPPSQKRGNRLPDDFQMPDEWITWAVSKRGWSRAESREEGECFIRFWQAKPGREACKLDWFKTWQNWAVNSRRRSADEDDGRSMMC